MAQPAGRGPVVAIKWIAWDPDQCPDAAYVEAKTARLLDGATADAPRLRARAVVVRDESGPWRVDLSTENATGTGHRSVTAETCRAAADATARILALAVDAEGGATHAGADSTPAVTAPPTPAETAPAPAASPSHETPVPGPDRPPSKIFSAGVTRSPTSERYPPRSRRRHPAGRDSQPVLSTTGRSRYPALLRAPSRADPS